MPSGKTVRCIAAARAGLALLSGLAVAGTPASAGSRYSFNCTFSSACVAVSAHFTLEYNRNDFKIARTERVSIERPRTGCPKRDMQGFGDKKGVRARMGDKTPRVRKIILSGISPAGDAAVIAVDRKSRRTPPLGKLYTELRATISFEGESSLSKTLGADKLHGKCFLFPKN